MLEARAIELTDKALAECAAFMRLVFPQATHFTKEYLHWHYCENPLGKVIATNIYDDDVLVMHCAMQPVPGVVDGKAERALVILNIATHPDYRKRGLLKQAGDHAFQAAKDQGYAHAFGIANDYSVSPFKKYWNGHLVGTLTVKIGCGNMPETQEDYPFRYQHDWSGESLDWRLQRPNSIYRQLQVKGKTHVYAQTGKGPWVQMGVTEDTLDIPAFSGWEKLNPFKLWMGFDASRQWPGLYFDLPAKLRPVPLNFLFFDLTGQGRRFDGNDALFSPLGFDAY